MSWRQRALGYSIAAAVLAAVVIWSNALASRERAANFDFTLKDMNGQDVRLADFRGKPLIVNFWATWCGPCELEAPDLQALSETFKGRATIIGVSTDDTAEQIRAFARSHRLTYPLLVGRDRRDVEDAFGLGDGIPMTVFVNANGVIVSRLEGINTREWLEARIKTLF